MRGFFFAYLSAAGFLFSFLFPFPFLLLLFCCGLDTPWNSGGVGLRCAIRTLSWSSPLNKHHAGSNPKTERLFSRFGILTPPCVWWDDDGSSLGCDVMEGRGVRQDRNASMVWTGFLPSAN